MDVNADLDKPPTEEDEKLLEKEQHHFFTQLARKFKVHNHSYQVRYYKCSKKIIALHGGT